METRPRILLEFNRERIKAAYVEHFVKLPLGVPSRLQPVWQLFPVCVKETLWENPGSHSIPLNVFRSRGCPKAITASELQRGIHIELPAYLLQVLDTALWASLAMSKIMTI